MLPEHMTMKRLSWREAIDLLCFCRQTIEKRAFAALERQAADMPARMRQAVLETEGVYFELSGYRCWMARRGHQYAFKVQLGERPNAGAVRAARKVHTAPVLFSREAGHPGMTRLNWSEATELLSLTREVIMRRAWKELHRQVADLPLLEQEAVMDSAGVFFSLGGYDCWMGKRGGRYVFKVKPVAPLSADQPGKSPSV
mgnify:CR=1 FL=1